MGCRRGGTVLDIAERALAPELTRNFVALTAIHKELARKSPVPVRLQPQFHAVFVGHITQPGYVVIGQAVGNHTSHIPKETLRKVGAAHHGAVECKQIRGGVITEMRLEIFHKVITEILGGTLVAVGYDIFPRGAFLGWHMAHYVTYKAVIMVLQHIRVPTVDFKPLAVTFQRG